MPIFERPIINSPYDEPNRYRRLLGGRPTDEFVESRRKSELISAMPKSKSSRRSHAQLDLSVSDLGGDYIDLMSQNLFIDYGPSY